MNTKPKAHLQKVNRPKTRHGKNALFAKGGDMATKKMFPFMGKETKAEEAKEMKVKAKSKAKYDMGEAAEGVHGKSGKAKPTKYAGGGFTSSADGKATQGRTKGTMIAMKRGGSCK